MADIELEQDLRLQARVWRWHRAGRVAVAAFVAASLAGLCGSGPLAKRRVSAGRLTVTYERLVHRQAPAEMTIDIGAGAGAGPLALWLPRDWALAAGIESVVPEPESVAGELDRIIYIFNVKTPTRLGFRMSQRQPGLRRGRVGLSEGEAVDVVQLVLP